MKLLIFISFLLMLMLCSSGSVEGHEIADNDLYSSNKVEELYSGRMIPPTGPNPGHDPRVPAPPSSEELYSDRMMDYPPTGPNPRHDPRVPPPPPSEELYSDRMMDYPPTGPNPRHDPRVPPPPPSEELYSDRMMDYPPTGPNPRHDPRVPPPPPSDKENKMKIMSTE